jgi:2-phospho-L-lactate transferase/gluconeogenesis factor (CofD/UPF0052 family)
MINSTPSNGLIRVALLCGGRGSTTIIQELLRWPEIQLTLIVNAYDDGLSTGALRGFISEMLGPSDFRKNLSYLLDLHSEGQYALKTLLEYRLPKSITQYDISNLIEYIKTEKISDVIAPLRHLFEQLNVHIAERVRQFLFSFFNYAQTIHQPFDYCDCSMGNLIFAGAYLEQNKNFNAAAKELSQLVNSRALLVNVSRGENRILVGLKEDGELLANEAQIVSPQSPLPIRRIFLINNAITEEAWLAVATKSVAEKEAWLSELEALPEISPEAESTLATADIIIYGPGTQHSSLFPSYKIAAAQLRNASTAVKALIMNLETDHDIITFSASDVVDRALMYLGDENNSSHVITHVLLEDSLSGNMLARGKLLAGNHYKNIELVSSAFVNDFKNKVHNGRAVVEKTLALWEQSLISDQQQIAIDIFIDIHKRSLAIDALSEEFLEMDWKKQFSDVRMCINQSPNENITLPDYIKKTHYANTFPEIAYFTEWLSNGKSEYLVLLTGDGEYRFRDAMLGIQLLKQSHFGAVFGSRTQSRLQFRTSMQAAYGENKFFRILSLSGAFLMSAVYSLRFGIIFSDPLTGFRIFKRSKIAHLSQKIATKNAATPVAIAKYLINNNIEIAELPVNYRTFSGFTDPNWRIRRGIKNLLSIFI